MFVRLRMALAAFTAVCMAACQPVVPGGSHTPIANPAGRATIAVRIVTDQGMGVKALPKTAADIASYLIQLKQPGTDNTPETGDEGAPVYSTTIPAGTYSNPHTIPNISAGRYYLFVDAFDANGVSIVQPDTPRYSSNAVEVTGGAAIYFPSGTELTVNLKLAAGTKGKGEASVTMTPPAHIPPAIVYGASLVNRDYGDVTSMSSLAQDYVLKDIQEGTFDIWAYARNINTSTPSKPQATNITVSSEGVTVPSVINCTFAPASFSTPDNGVTFTTAQKPTIANDGTLYYIDGTSVKKLGDPSFSMTTAIQPSTIAVSPDGTAVYAAAGDKIVRHDGTEMATVTGTVMALAVAPDGRIYYALDDKTIRRIGETATLTTAEMATNLAVDQVGNVYYTEKDSAKIMMKVNRPGRYYGQLRSAGADVTINWINGAEFAGLAVDRSGALYLPVYNQNLILMIGAGDTEMLRVVGSGDAGTTDTAADALTADLTAPVGVAVSDTGTLYFASDNGTGFVVRKVE